MGGFFYPTLGPASVSSKLNDPARTARENLRDVLVTQYIHAGHNYNEYAAQVSVTFQQNESDIKASQREANVSLNKITTGSWL